MATEVWSKLGHMLGQAWNLNTLDQLWELGCRLSRREDRSMRIEPVIGNTTNNKLRD
ncbi:hypothetical protein QJS10_CPA09g01155 [Acorus calamus]|uniref:Uncharacterized protein n=1 Tax=Acorus calamus TaxID=4465 RepID=A0AAV9E590_ACOCL|nr:hypothetical protein QJS10_CPA09g01155 [Acorus calamus]